MNEDFKDELLDHVCFGHVRNRNEHRVVKGMERLFKRVDTSKVSEKDQCDIYAFALNLLPARYLQRGTIVLGEPVRDDAIDEAVLAAYVRILAQPKI